MKISMILHSLALACHAAGQSQTLVRLWETDAILSSPESVLYSEEDKLLYVSNMGSGKDPIAKDGDGSIGKIGPDGKVIAGDWVKGLHAPKGLDSYHGKLYVADIDRVVVIDIASGKITDSISPDGAKSLNDLTIDAEGTIYVSDYEKGKIVAIKDGKPSVFIDNLENPNGVLSHGHDFYFVAKGVLYKRRKGDMPKPVVTGLDGGVDGIENIDGKEFIVSCWRGIVYHVNVSTGAKQTLLDQREAGILSADIGIDSKNRIVYVPTLFTNQVVAYQLE